MTKASLLVLLALLVLVPVAGAQSGYATTIHVTDSDKHAGPKSRDVTYVRYAFDYAQAAPNPEAPLAADCVGNAWLFLNVEHQYHDGRLFHYDVVEENTLVLNVYFNQFKLVYEAHVRVEDSAWNLRRLFTDGDGRGSVTIRYRVYDADNVLVADEEEVERIHAWDMQSIPDSRLWITYENRTLTVSPDFTGHGFLPHYLRQRPPDNPGRVQIHNADYESLELEVVSTKTLQEVRLGYGFARPGHAPGYTLGSITEDVITNLRSASLSLVLEVLTFVLGLLPGGDKLLVVKEYVTVILEAAWDILVQDPLLFARVILILATGLGLLLWIDPMFVWLFSPPWYVVKGFWKIVTFLWTFTTNIVTTLAGRLGFGGGK